MTRRFRSRIAPLVALILTATAFTGAAFHARLERAEPGISGVVKTAPTRVQFWFNQPVNPRLTSATVLTDDSTRIGAVTFASTSDSLSVAGALAATLTPGRYRVQWRTMSQDGHPIRGEYRFTFTP